MRATASRQRTDQTPHDDRRIVAIRQTVEHARRALGTTITRIGTIGGIWDPTEAGHLSCRRFHEQTHFPMPCVITQRDGRTIGGTNATQGADQEKFGSPQMCRIPAHTRILAEGEDVTTRRGDDEFFVERQFT